MTIVSLSDNTNIKLACFAILCFGLVYILNCVIARKRKQIELKSALLYMSAVAMIGVFGEVFVGSLYKALFNSTLWEYNFYPLHNGYTSRYGVFLWAILGFHLYLLSGYLKGKGIKSRSALSAIFSIEALVLEISVSALFFFVFGQYVFYYFPSDLWHFTSIQTLPFYFVTGYVITRAIEHFGKDRKYFTEMCIALTFVMLYLV